MGRSLPHPPVPLLARPRAVLELWAGTGEQRTRVLDATVSCLDSPWIVQDVPPGPVDAFIELESSDAWLGGTRSGTLEPGLTESLHAIVR